MRYHVIFFICCLSATSTHTMQQQLVMAKVLKELQTKMPKAPDITASQPMPASAQIPGPSAHSIEIPEFTTEPSYPRLAKEFTKGAKKKAYVTRNALGQLVRVIIENKDGITAQHILNSGIIIVYDTDEIQKGRTFILPHQTAEYQAALKLLGNVGKKS